MPQATTSLSITVLRSLFRELQTWRALSEDNPSLFSLMFDGVEYNIWDIERLYAISQSNLSPRQSQAIRMFLVEQRYEREVAQIMGIGLDCPVGTYASNGLRRLIGMIESGDIRWEE